MKSGNTIEFAIFGDRQDTQYMNFTMPSDARDNLFEKNPPTINQFTT